MSSIEDSIMVTGLRMTGGVKFNPNPNITTSSGMQQMQDTKGLTTNFKAKKSAKKHKIRAESNEPAYSDQKRNELGFPYPTFINSAG